MRLERRVGLDMGREKRVDVGKKRRGEVKRKLGIQEGIEEGGCWKRCEE